MENHPESAEEAGSEARASRASAQSEAAMSMRLVQTAALGSATGCCRCVHRGERWDRIAGKAYCPECQESLAGGEAEPLVERTEPKPCAICAHRGTICFQTFPLEAGAPVEMDLCPEHLRSLLSRRLGPYGYHQLQRQLQALGIDASEVFLLHEAFYDHHGRALKPVQEVI
jgi:hypothetical protein